MVALFRMLHEGKCCGSPCFDFVPWDLMIPSLSHFLTLSHQGRIRFCALILYFVEK